MGFNISTSSSGNIHGGGDEADMLQGAILLWLMKIDGDGKEGRPSNIMEI